LVRWPLTGLLYQLWMIDDECGTVSEMRIIRGNRSTRRKPAPVSLLPPQIPHVLTWARTRAAAVDSRRLIASAVARPTFGINNVFLSPSRTKAVVKSETVMYCM
jgi:hypothetical protein